MNVVIIDDEVASLNTFLIKSMDNPDLLLQMFNKNPLASVEYVQRNKVEVAFLDINMPIINGVELAERLIEANDNILIVFITGYAHNEMEISNRIGRNLIGFCYKPYNQDTLDKIISKIQVRLKAKRAVEIRTFGCFDVLINNEPVKFTGRKSKELLALLIDKCGSFVPMEIAATSLWPDNLPANSKRLYRDAVYKLRRDLASIELDIVEFGWGQLRLINYDNISCDYWDYIKDPNSNIFCGSYLLPSYEWAIDTEMMLINLNNK